MRDRGERLGVAISFELVIDSLARDAETGSGMT